MSQSGTLLVLRNIGPDACRIAPFPDITLKNAKGPLPVQFSVEGARFMHPGPAVFPVVVAAGAELTSTLHWVAGPVFTKNVCLHPTSIILRVRGKEIGSEFAATICGEQGEGVKVTMTRLATDPVYAPDKRK